MRPSTRRVLAPLALLIAPTIGLAEEPARSFDPQWMSPFWKGHVQRAEPVLFVAENGGEAKGSVLFPIAKILRVTDATGKTEYTEAKDFAYREGSREIVLPKGSRIVSKTPADLRRPAKSQQYALTHRDGKGEILFGGKLEYHDMQTSITYSHVPDAWKAAAPKHDPRALPRATKLLAEGRPLSIVVLGDSISTGCNASGWGGGAPFQPAYPELLKGHLEHRFGGKIGLANLSVGGKDTRWALTMVDQVVEHKPDLVVVAFGMNDSAGRPAKEYRDNIKALMDRIREKRPEAEFVLVATMLGNRDWTALKQELFPAYRDALAELSGPGAALADLTSIWAEFLRLKPDRDLTGNGVNHPNDFGHRVYAQVIATTLDPDLGR